MSRPWASAFRWLIPAIATLMLVVLLTHKSSDPHFFSRYSHQYLILLIAMALWAGTCWWVALDGDRYRRFTSRIPIVSSLVVLGGLVMIVDIFHPVDTYKYFLAPAIPAVLAVIILFSSSRNPRKVTHNLALLATATVIGLVLAEGVFRLAFVKNQIPTTEREFEALISSSWPRPVSVEKEPDTYRILGLADSFGQYGGFENYHYLLENMVNADGSRVEVVNISQTATEPVDQLDLLRRFGPRYRPDLVLHGFFVGNDFSVVSGTLMHYRNIPLRGRVELKSIRPRNFMLFQWLRWYMVARRAMVGRDLEAADDGGPSATYALEDFLRIEHHRMQTSLREPHPTRRWQHVVSALDEIQGETRRMGARYVMLIHPDQYQVEPSLRQQVADAYDLELKPFDFDLPQRFLRGYCIARGITCIDVLPQFRAAGSGGGLYLLRDTHYNKDGNSLAATIAAQCLRDRGLIPSEKGRGRDNKRSSVCEG